MTFFLPEKLMIPADAIVNSLTVETMFPVEAIKVSSKSFCFFCKPDSIRRSDIMTRLFSGSLILWENSAITSSFFPAVSAASLYDSPIILISPDVFLATRTRSAAAVIIIMPAKSLTLNDMNITAKIRQTRAAIVRVSIFFFPSGNSFRNVN